MQCLITEVIMTNKSLASLLPIAIEREGTRERLGRKRL